MERTNLQEDPAREWRVDRTNEAWELFDRRVRRQLTGATDEEIQECLIRFYTRYRLGDALPMNVWGYSWTTVQRIRFDESRKRERSEKALRERMNETQQRVTECPTSGTRVGELRERLIKALADLACVKWRQYVVYRLRVDRRLMLSQIADVFEVAISTVHSDLDRARAFLESRLLNESEDA